MSYAVLFFPEMRPITIMTFWTVCFLNIAALVGGARILAIITIPSYSHQIPFQPLWISLSRRGHEVVVLTTDPINDSSLTNLTEIDFRFNYALMKTMDFTKKRYTDTWLDILHSQFWNVAAGLSKSVYEHPEVRKMYAPNSGVKFDVVFVEMLKTPAVYALAHRFNAPLIGLASLGLYANNYYFLGQPVLTSHPSTWEMENDTGFNLPLWHRIKNFIRLWHHMYFILNYFMPQQQKIAEKYLGKDIPDVGDMERNLSIIFCNQQDVISFTRPKPSNFISFGGFHVSAQPALLPKDLKKFVDDAPNGFIYVSLGTNIMMSSFSQHVQDIFFDVLANLPCKVVWKIDIELPNKPDNIYSAKWFPQQSVLAHPNIKLFVYQGGLQSTEEAVHYSVPLIGLPMLADQNTQVRKMVSLGVAKYLNIINIERKILNASIIDILNDKSYKKRMDEVKALYDDKPYDLLENAIWWTEFVIRHKGAPHLHTSIAYDPWYMRYDMDIVAILSVAAFVILLCALKITCKLLQLIFKSNTRMLIDRKKKVR